MKFLSRIAAFVAIGLSAIILSACEPSSASDARQAAARAETANRAAQDNVMASATAKIPVPVTKNFLARKNLAEYMKRMDDPAKTWYVYILADNGAKLGYYVASTYPQSSCSFMTPPEQVKEVSVGGQGSNPIAITSAPSLMGVYYKGGGCDNTFFFDANSSALIILTGVNTWASDVPLNIDAPLITVAKTQ
ncbi:MULTISPECIES: hypothetical protein [unclassified Ensifer]|uniref:hypothetical protein n=1 Tax=unclassified Ensifer TaxID=2633371 RepID=UPI000813D7C0|nr:MULTISPECIES: hypothetical protein [unclassified Ensifer]OCP21987.1 hypothetical protein BC361_25810 [Ensifer sp. LC54]OCP23233.1 hypothetical protein BC363_24955 [Ensifer sp. LC384]